MTRSLAAVVLVAVAVPLLAGCASADRAAGARLFRTGRYEQAREFFEAQLAQEPDNTALDRSDAGVMALLQGDVDAARRHFEEAFFELEDLSATSGETVEAVVGSASSRRWKGEPYERCLNAYYLGLAYWLQGDTDNAAASFRAGVLRDADSEEGASQSDFALLWYLLGQAQRAANHTDRGATALARAAELLDSNPWAQPDAAAQGNVVVVVEMGAGPRKVATGPHGAWLRFEPGPEQRAAAAHVRAGDRDLGATASLGDVYFQAITRGDKVIDHVNQGKAVFKDAAVVAGAILLDGDHSRDTRLVGAGLVLAGLLIPAETDLRQWVSLPGQVHVLLADLPPGRHVLHVDVRDAAGDALPWMSSAVPIEVRAGRVTLAWTRAISPPPSNDEGGRP